MFKKFIKSILCMPMLAIVISNFMSIPMQIVFLILKWTGAVNWHWAVVLIPTICGVISWGISFMWKIVKDSTNEIRGGREN